VHLDSLSDTLHYRTQQIKILAHNTQKSKYAQGIIAGDFNAITSQDHKLIDENGLRDQWLKLNDKDADGDTWSNSHGEAGRLDKITMIGLEADKIRPGLIKVPSPGQDNEEIPWSDHSGLTCSFNF
jgi:tyrosyl-DNA phosphodiesterase 2